MNTDTSAGGQMAGYLWQAVEACRRCLTSPSNAVIKIEIEDDISIARMDGVVESCEQLKHSEKAQTISEESPVWWQTVDAWIRGPAPNTPKLRLVTTNDLQAESLLASCYQPTSVAPWDGLLEAMDERAREKPNKRLAEKGVYARWLGFTQRRELLTRIQIASAQGSLEASNDLLEQALMEERGVSPAIVTRVRESFVGAFFGKLTNALDSGGFEVTIKEMNATFLEAHASHVTRGEYEFIDLECTDEDINELRVKHHQHLVPQLAAIDKDSSGIVARAMENWFRARTHRQKLMEGSPYEIKDLRSHDKDLEQFCQTIHEERDPVTDFDLGRIVGKGVYAECMKHQSRLGRTHPPLDFSQGSYHELINTIQLRWNPLYEEEK